MSVVDHAEMCSVRSAITADVVLIDGLANFMKSTTIQMINEKGEHEDRLRDGELLTVDPVRGALDRKHEIKNAHAFINPTPHNTQQANQPQLHVSYLFGDAVEYTNSFYLQDPYNPKTNSPSVEYQLKNDKGVVVASLHDKNAIDALANNLRLMRESLFERLWETSIRGLATPQDLWQSFK